MSTKTFDISYSATAQMAMLLREEQAALTKLFSSNDLTQPSTTETMSDARFVSRLGTKRVSWRRLPERKPEIIAIVDQSFAESG